VHKDARFAKIDSRASLSADAIATRHGLPSHASLKKEMR
jgi:hypothetical protein